MLKLILIFFGSASIIVLKAVIWISQQWDIITKYNGGM
jgi:hypothetical protein